jgi:hypothetical protein
MSLTRRQFLQRSGLLAGGSALGGLAALGADPEQLRADTVPLD